ncbi:MAG: Pyridoxine 4-dehydrogenase [Sclerophora amabilis]|nr:MAG: Pyridoxine 4-dehydrogenase [Sclerophora amabilis]
MATVVGKNVGTTAFGLMNLTWRPQQTPDEQAFAAMDRAISLGAIFWFGAEFYGQPDPTLNLHLLRRYFTSRPQNADKVVLCIKGGADITTKKPKGSPTDVKASVDHCNQILGGTKKIDVFSCARVDKTVPFEETISALAEYVKQGKIGGIGLSESSADTIRRASKVHPISNVEVEFSLWATEILENGVAEACKEHGIPVTAYAPLGRGFLTGQIRSPSDIPEGDIRHHLDRFQPENFDKNFDLVDAVQKVAEKKGVTNSQLALAWVKAHSGKGSMPTIIPIPGATRESQVAENCVDISLSEQEKTELDKMVASVVVKGLRYNAMMEGSLFG